MNDVEYVRGLLARAVEEKGADYVYPRAEIGQCLYVEDRAPSCIVGHVLHYHGVPLRRIALHEGDNASVVCPQLVPEWSGLVFYALREAQRAQDDGATWGEALKAFDKYIRDHG